MLHHSFVVFAQVVQGVHNQAKVAYLLWLAAVLRFCQVSVATDEVTDHDAGLTDVALLSVNH